MTSKFTQSISNITSWFVPRVANTAGDDLTITSETSTTGGNISITPSTTTDGIGVTYPIPGTQLQQQQLMQQYQPGGMLVAQDLNIDFNKAQTSLIQSGPHDFLEDLVVWIDTGKKYSHYKFHHKCTEDPVSTPGDLYALKKAFQNVRPPLAILPSRCVCTECGKDFPEYKKLVTMWKMGEIGKAKNGGVQKEE